ncbi:MAG: hypothetical protein AAFV96_04745, partial [Pseudomonadota bacterium]
MSKTALVVEDNALNCALFLEILRHAGFATICDTTGVEAQRLAESVRPAIALVDLQLPENLEKQCTVEGVILDNECGLAHSRSS